MPKRNLRGLIVPEVNDPLIETLADSFAQAGVYVPAASPAAAYLILDQMDAAGQKPTSTAPVMFIIGSGVQRNVYMADGSKTDAGGWRLQALGQSEQVINTYNTTWGGTREFTATNAFSGMMATSLPVRPYDRRVNAIALAWGASTSGYVNLRLQMHDGSYCQSRFTTDDSTVIAIGGCDIPAGETPVVSAGIDGAGKVRLSSAYSQNRLIVTADPIDMA